MNNNLVELTTRLSEQIGSAPPEDVGTFSAGWDACRDLFLKMLMQEAQLNRPAAKKITMELVKEQGRFTATCSVCPWTETWNLEYAANSAAVWHLYLKHFDQWIEVAGGPVIPHEYLPDSVYGAFKL